MLYYTGRVIADLASRNLFGVQDRSHIKVCLGGRTSQLYKVMFGDDFGSSSDASQILDIFSDAAAGAADSASLVFTEDPKHEVAYGLLVETSGGTNLDTESRYKDVILGEALEVGGESVSDSTVVSDLDPQSDWRITNLPGLKDFLLKLEEHRGLELVLSDEMENEVIGMVNGSLVETRERLIQEQAEGVDAVETTVRGESALVEPVFVTVLRSLFPLVISGKTKMKSQ